MSLRFQRLLIIFLSLIFLTLAVLLILINSKKNIVFFYTPSELINSNKKINDTIRIGGFVEKGSLKNEGNNKFEFFEARFSIPDLRIRFNGGNSRRI